jgi:lipoprotein plpD
MKLLKTLLISLSVALVAACGNLSKVTNEGTLADGHELVWPKIEKSGFNHDGSQFGTWPNLDNLTTVELSGKGMNKDQLHNLLGRPHFAEGLFGVSEWDYVFNFKENGVHKICQYKILFDKNHNAQSFFWNPVNCGLDKQIHEVSADFLFGFDSSKLTEQGKTYLVEYLKQLTDAKSLTVIGYTDKLGSDKYNVKLATARTESVKEFLIQNGIKADINTKGFGKDEKQVQCDNFKSSELIDCLAPNRRVEIISYK